MFGQGRLDSDKIFVKTLVRRTKHYEIKFQHWSKVTGKKRGHFWINARTPLTP